MFYSVADNQKHLTNCGMHPQTCSRKHTNDQQLLLHYVFFTSGWTSW